MFSRLKNLTRINKLYGLFRDWIENPKKRTKKHLAKMWDVLQDITEFKELIAREKLEALKGNKTYIVAGLAGLATTAKVLGYIDEDTYQTIMGFLVALGGATLAAKVNRTNAETSYKINTLLNPINNPLAIPAAQTMKNEYNRPSPAYQNTGSGKPLETKYNPPKK
jgi:hypothetical protein